MYKAAIAPASGLAFVPSGSSTPVVLHPPQAAPSGGWAVQHGNLRVVTLPGAQDWVPDPSWLSWVGGWSPLPTTITFVRRPETVPKAYRAVADRPHRDGSVSVRILVDETETRDSIRWLVLHEMAHVLVSADPTLAETLRAGRRPSGYPHDDDAHEAVLEEQVANAFADRLAPVPGLDRRWWRKRTKGYVQPSLGFGSPNYGQMPSETAAEALWAGREGAWKDVLWTATQRAGILAAGLWLAGERERLLRYAVAGSLAIEAVVLAYARPRE